MFSFPPKHFRSFHFRFHFLLVCNTKKERFPEENERKRRTRLRTLAWPTLWTHRHNTLVTDQCRLHHYVVSTSVLREKSRNLSLSFARARKEVRKGRERKEREGKKLCVELLKRFLTIVKKGHHETQFMLDLLERNTRGLFCCIVIDLWITFEHQHQVSSISESAHKTRHKAVEMNQWMGNIWGSFVYVYMFQHHFNTFAFSIFLLLISNIHDRTFFFSFWHFATFAILLKVFYMFEICGPVGVAAATALFSYVCLRAKQFNNFGYVLLRIYCD